jgi:hypothetical protein
MNFSAIGPARKMSDCHFDAGEHGTAKALAAGIM